MTDTAAAVRTEGLTKRFGAHKVVDTVDLEVPHGSVYGFLGPNGSGKTTTIRMLLGLIRATSGRVDLLGEPMPHRSSQVLHRVGSLVEGPAFHPYLSGRSNLARLDAADRRADPRTARARIGAALERVGLAAAAGKRYRAYSLGMRQRLAIAAALLAPRDLLILDEPTNGLDPQGTREVRSLIGSLAADGSTILVSSHLLAEVEQVCTHLGVMSTGRLVAQGPIAEVGSGQRARCRLLTRDGDLAVTVLRECGVQEVVQVPQPDGLVTVTGLPGQVVPDKIVAALVHAGVGVHSFTVVTPSLEDAFVALTGEGFDVSG